MQKIKFGILWIVVIFSTLPAGGDEINGLSNCTMHSIDHLDLGAYDPIDLRVKTIPMTLKVICSGDVKSYQIFSEETHSGSQRMLKQGNDSIGYQFYMDPNLSLPLGTKGGAGSPLSHQNLNCSENSPCLHTLYVAMQARQLAVRSGRYVDQVTLTMVSE